MASGDFSNGAFLVVLIALCIGCGGSGSNSGSGTNVGAGTTSTPVGGQTATAGQAVFTFLGHPKANVDASTGTVSTVAQAGATYTSVSIYPSPTLTNSYIAFSRSVNSVGSIYAVPYTGNANYSPTVLSQSVEGQSSPACSRNGEIAFNQVIGINLFNMRADGTSLSQLSVSGPAYALYPSYSPDGTKIAVDGGGAELWYGPAGGGTFTVVQRNDNAEGTAWSPNNASIAYVASNGSGYNNIFTTLFGGGNSNNVTPYNMQHSGNWSNPTWNVDGFSMAATYVPTSSSTSQVVRFATNTSASASITPSGYSDTFPSFSPDGKLLAFYRSNAGGATPGIYVSNLQGTSPTLIVPDPPSSGGLTGPVTGLDWSPFFAERQFLGATGGQWDPVNPTGFLLTQNSSAFASLVDFVTTTPSTATVTSPTGSGGSQAPLLFTISGDAITRIGWTNAYFGIGIKTTPSGGATSAVVSIDGSTGAVDLVAPAFALSKQTEKVAGGFVSFAGKFSAIYDGAGKNLAPSGASHLVVNPKTGKMVAFR
jgi:hypothetical protein